MTCVHGSRDSLRGVATHNAHCTLVMQGAVPPAVKKGRLLPAGLLAQRRTAAQEVRHRARVPLGAQVRDDFLVSGQFVRDHDNLFMSARELCHTCVKWATCSW